MAHNTLVIHDNLYEITKSYQAGARAFRRGVPWKMNPHRDGSQAHDDWNYGHENESNGEHLRFGIDVIDARRTSKRFEMDPDIARNEHGEVINKTKLAPPAPPVFSTRARLKEPNADFCSAGRTTGVWQRKTITAGWKGQVVELVAEQGPVNTCCCVIIRVDDEFFVAHDFGNPKERLKSYKKAAAQQSA